MRLRQASVKINFDSSTRAILSYVKVSEDSITMKQLAEGSSQMESYLLPWYPAGRDRRTERVKKTQIIGAKNSKWNIGN